MPKIDIDPVIDIIKRGIPIAEMLARIYTATEWDDQFVAILKWIVNDASIIAMLRLVFDDPEVIATSGPARSAAIYKALAMHSTDAHAAAVVKAGFSWLLLLEYAPQVITFILTLLGRRR